jgi:hypothetical protein
MSSHGTRKKLKPLTQAEQHYINKYEDNIKKLQIINTALPKPVVRKSKKQLKREEDEAKAKLEIEKQL